MPATVSSVNSNDSLGQDAAAEPAGFQVIDVNGDVVTLHNFHVRNQDVAAYVGKLPVEDREIALTRAIEVGVFCLERASNSTDTDFVKRQVERVLGELERQVGSIPATIRDELLKKVGTGEGQVLQPVLDASKLVSQSMEERIAEVRQLFAEQLDPARDTSSLGKALKALQQVLDPARKDSAQGALDAVITKATGEDGVLAKSVKAVVTEAMKPLQDEVDSLAKEIRGDEAAQEALMQTTEKGEPYEIVVVEVVRPLANVLGAEVQHVGGDNKAGDVTFKLASNSVAGGKFSLVIEARDRGTAMGHKAIADELIRKMAERGANAAIYVSRTPAGLGREIGDWAEGENDYGPWVATMHENLRTAIRFLMVQHRLRSMKSDSPEFDGPAIENQLQRIRTALKRVKNIKTKVTAVHASADYIETEAIGIQDEVREALNAIEDAIRQKGIAAE